MFELTREKEDNLDMLSVLDAEMIQANVFNNNYTNDRLSRIKNPIILDSIDLPKSRAIHCNMLNTIEEENYESLSFINSIDRDRILMYNKSTISKPMGRLIIKKKNFDSYNAKVKKVFKNTRTVKANDKLVVGNRDLMVFNYKLIHNIYNYQQHKTREYSRLINSLSTMIDEINSKGDFAYNIILLDAPIDFPIIETLRKYTLKKVDNALLSRMKSIDSLLVYELWKMLFPKAKSIFNNIDKNRRDNTYFAFTRNGKYTIYKMNDLIALSKPMKIESGRMSQVEELMAGKLLILSLLRFISRSELPVDSEAGVEDRDNEENNEIFEVEVDEELSELGAKLNEESETKETTLVNARELSNKKTTFTKLASNAKENNDVLIDKIENSAKGSTLSKNESSKLSEVVNNQMNRRFVINGKSITLEEILDYDTVDSTLTDIPMKDSKSVVEKSMLSNTNRKMDKDYITMLYYKDLYNAIYSLQNDNVVITDHEVTTTKSMLGSSERHRITLKPLDGLPSTIEFVIPVIDPEDGTYRMSSNEYLLRLQRKDSPIRKTSPNDVLLTSYKGKLFINKNLYQSHNPSKWLANHIASNDRFTNLIMKASKPFDVELPVSYTLVSSNISRFTYKPHKGESEEDDTKGIDFVFDYFVRFSMLSDEDSAIANKMESKYGFIFIGKSKNRDTLYFMSNDGGIKAINNNKILDKGDLEGFFKLDLKKMAGVSCNIKILGTYIPIGLIMLDYVGIDKLLKLLESKPKIIDREEKYKLDRYEYDVILADKVLIFDKNDRKTSLMFYGLPRDVLANMKYDELNDKESLSVIYNLYGLGIAQINAISDIETMFLDNITKDRLKLMGEPTDIHNLLIRAVELLVDDNYKNPNNILENDIVRYERIPGLVYKSLSRAKSSYNNRNTLSKARITMDPYEIWRAIGDDSTSMLVENNNPIATIKQRDNITYLGEFGRSRITMTLPSRVMNADEVGIISEATPDSGDSGISTYFTHSASLSNIRGGVSPIDISKETINRALSSANIVNPFIVTDDIKRANFANTQSSHIIPMNKMKSQRVWTGGEAVIAHKVGKPFIYSAKESGRVTKLTKDMITITYSKPIETNKVLLMTNIDDKTLIRSVYEIISDKGYIVTTNEKDEVLYKVFIGDTVAHKDLIRITSDKHLLSALSKIVKAKTTDDVVKYSLKPWSTKIEGGTSIKHTMTTTLREGDRVGIDDIITYDADFFEPNIFDKRSVVLRMGSSILVSFMETKITLEDSIGFNRHILDDAGETKYNVMSKILDTNSHITNVIPEGSVVSYNDKLMSIVDSAIVNDETLSDRAREILSDINDRSPKANANGVIDRIDVYYNCSLDDMDESIRKLAIESNKRFKFERDVDGRVTSEYSINGKPLLPGEIELKYYIASRAPAEIGDKYVIGHQMKNTVGYVYDDILTEDGERVGGLFGNRSVFSRIVNSSFVLGTTNILQKHFSDNAVKAYKGA